MTLFELFAKISLDSSDYEKGLSSASGLTQSFGDKAKAALGTVGKTAAVGLTAATGAAVAFGKSAVDAGMGFDSAMSQIAATLGMSVQDIQNNVGGAGDTFDMLRKKAMEMGASTNFSAKEAADGLNILAMSGYDAKSSVAMIEDVLHLAAAGAMDMGNAAAYISGTMKGFNDATKDSGYYADLMAKGATLANTSVSQLGEAMSSGAAGAASYKQSADSMTLSLLRLAEQGEVGSAAGTALAAAMKDIYTPTDQAKKALKNLGVAAYENGKALDFNDVVNNLSAALSNLSDEQANEYKQTIFGIQGLNAFNKMAVTGTEKQNEWAQALASASDGMGEAAKQYDTMTDNLQGDLDSLSSAWEGMQIVVSDQLTPAVREFVQFGTSGITAVTDAFKREETVRGLSDAIRDAEGNLLSAGQVAGVLSETLYSMSESDRQIAIREIFNTDDMEYVNELLNENGENWGYLMGYVAEIDAASEATNGWAAAMGTLGPVVSDAVTMILEGLPQAVEVGGQLLGAVVTGIINAIPALADGALQVAGAFGGYLKGAMESALDSIGILEPVKNAFSGVGEAFDRIGESVSPLVEKFEAWASSAETAQGAAGLLETGLTLLGNAVSGVAGFVADIVEVGAGFIDWLADAAANGSPFITILGALAGGMGAFMAAIEINTMIGFAAQLGGLPGIFAAVQTAVSASTLGIQGLFNVLAANPIILVVTLIGSLVAAFITAYNTSEDFRNKVDSAMATVKAVVGNVVSAIVNFFTVTIPNAVQTAVDWFQQLPSKIRDVGARLLEGLWNGISDKVEWLKGKVSGVVDKIKGWFTGSSGFDEHSPSHWAERVGEYVSIGLANGIEKEATEAEKAAEKMASNIYSGLSKWADRVTKYEAPSLRDQLSMWEAILDQFEQGTDQWWNAYDKVFDLREQIDAERAKSLEAQEKAVEQAVKDRYSALTAWIDKSVKYTGASYTEQMRMWDNILSEFADDSEQYASIEEKLFDLRLSAYQDYADRVEEISGNLADIQQSYDEAVQKRTEEIAGSYKLFDAIPEKQEVSGKELLNNLQKQIHSIRSFYDNLTELQERGMSAAVVDEIRSMGVGASDQLEALLSLSDKKLAQYADLYEEKQSLANSVALSELGELGNETAAKIQEQMDDLKALYDSEAPTLGESFADGIAQGIRNGFSGVMEAAVETARSALDKTREILFGVPQSASVPASITSGAYAYHAVPTSAASAPSILPDSSGYPAPIQVEIKAEPAPLIIDGREFARVIYQYFVEESNRQGRQLIVT